jgi:hypothetical protein
MLRDESKKKNKKTCQIKNPSQVSLTLQTRQMRYEIGIWKLFFLKKETRKKRPKLLKNDKRN